LISSSTMLLDGVKVFWDGLNKDRQGPQRLPRAS
jgi:hypothetical protein